MIEIKKYTELSSQIKNQLNTHIEHEFGHIPFVKNIKWATPDWTIIQYEESQIAAFYNIIEREVLIDEVKYKVAGINNVIAPKEFRGKGLTSQMLRQTEGFIWKELKCELGLLLCADELIPFYERLGWYKIKSTVYYSQPNERRSWEANTMGLSKNGKLNPKEVDLNGLPW